MIKNALPSLRQRAGLQRICSRQKSIRSGTARDSFSQTPHMRGKVISMGFFNVTVRITPACAGKRRCLRFHPGKTQDHPHMCGEKPKVMNLVLVRPGSPPRMRGKACAGCDGLILGGITPAHAGKRSCRCSRWPQPWDHPRICGEKRSPSPALCTPSGSPPRMRGKCVVHVFVPEKFGITPAHAGEKQQSALGDFSGKGSPPRMRGKAIHGLALGVHAGITPACAGKRSGPSPAAVPAGPAGSCPASRPSQFPPRMTVIKPRP